MNQDYEQIPNQPDTNGNANNNVQPNNNVQQTDNSEQNNPYAVPYSQTTYDATNATYNYNNVAYDDGGQNYNGNKKNGKKIALIVLGIIIIILIILLLLKFCFGGGKLNDILVGDVPVMYVGEKYTITASAIGKGKLDETQFIFEIDNNNIASNVNKIQVGSSVEDTINALEVGTTSLTVKGSIGNGDSITKTADVIVCDRIDPDGISNNTITLNVGETKDLGLGIGSNPKCLSGLTFSTSNGAVATVDDNGKITGVAPGKAELTISDGQNTITYGVEVSDPNAKISVTGIKVSASSIKVYIGNYKTIKLFVTPITATNKSVTWSIANSSIASISQKGVVKGKKAGKTTVTIKANDGSGKTAKVTVTVVKKPTKPATPTKVLITKLNFGSPSYSTTVGGTVTATVGITPANASNPTITCSSSNTAIATVTVSGKSCVVKGIKAGTVTITAKANDGSGKTATTTVTVKAVSGGSSGGGTKPSTPSTPALSCFDYCRQVTKLNVATCNMECGR